MGKANKIRASPSVGMSYGIFSFNPHPLLMAEARRMRDYTREEVRRALEEENARINAQIEADRISREKSREFARAEAQDAGKRYRDLKPQTSFNRRRNRRKPASKH